MWIETSKSKIWFIFSGVRINDVIAKILLEDRRFSGHKNLFVTFIGINDLARPDTNHEGLLQNCTSLITEIKFNKDRSMFWLNYQQSRSTIPQYDRFAFETKSPKKRKHEEPPPLSINVKYDEFNKNFYLM